MTSHTAQEFLLASCWTCCPPLQQCPAHKQSQCSHPAPYSSSLPCTQSPHSWPVTCSSSHAHSCRAATPVPFPLTARREQRSFPVPYGNFLPHTHAQSQPSYPAPYSDSRRGTHTEGVLPPVSLQPCSYTHTRTTMVVSRDPRTPTRSPCSHPVPYSASHTANTPTPFSTVTASCKHTCTHTCTHNQHFAWFPMAIPTPPRSLRSFSASQSD